MCKLDSGNSEAAAIKKTAEERSPGTSTFAPGQFDFTVGANTESFAPCRSIGTPNSSSASSVWSRVRAGSVRRRFAVGKQSRQQHRGFHLRAGHRHFVVNAAQFSTANFQRREIIVTRVNLRAHFAQRSQNALHRSLVQRIVAGNFGGEVLSGQEFRKAGGSSCRNFRRPANANCFSVRANRGRLRAPNPFPLSLPHPATFMQPSVLWQSAASAKLAHFGGAFGDARQHRVAMRNGFVARRHAHRRQPLWPDELFFCSRPLAQFPELFGALKFRLPANFSMR